MPSIWIPPNMLGAGLAGPKAAKLKLAGGIAPKRRPLGGQTLLRALALEPPAVDPAPMGVMTRPKTRR